MLTASDRWREHYPQAHVGLLVMEGVRNPSTASELEAAKPQLEAQLRSRFAGLDRGGLRADPTLAAYDAYYRNFKKTYHLLLQLESVVFKGRPISAPSALVEAMFMAELQNLLLTAGHDLKYVAGGMVADVATGEEVYTRLGDRQQRTKAGDMMISDERGILSSVLYGPDHHSRLRSETDQVAFTVYAPAGIATERIRGHLNDIEEYVLLVAPSATRRILSVEPEAP